LLLALLVCLAYRGSMRSIQSLPSSNNLSLSISYDLFTLLSVSSVPSLTILFWVILCVSFLHILIILPFSVHLFHPFFVSGLYLCLFSTLSPTHDFRLHCCMVDVFALLGCQMAKAGFYRSILLFHKAIQT
jgi:hypothetical protein